MFWTQGAKVSQESFAPPKLGFAPVQLCFAPVQEAFGALGPKDLSHPLLTTFGNFLFAGPLPRPLDHRDFVRDIRSGVDNSVRCVITQAFFSRGVSVISLKSRFFQRNLAFFQRNVA